MTRQEKIKQIERWWKEGKITKYQSCYTVPSEAFLLGITPRLINRVLKAKEGK